MSRIFWDSNLFIYLLENYGALSQTTATLRKKMLERGDQLLTSALSLGEILVKPLEKGDLARCAKYEATLAATSILMMLGFKANM